MSNDPTPSSAAKTTQDSVAEDSTDPPVREPGSVTTTKHKTPADGSEFKVDS